MHCGVIELMENVKEINQLLSALVAGGIALLQTNTSDASVRLHIDLQRPQ